MTKNAAKERSAEVREVKALMVLRGISTVDLSAKIGFDFRHVGNVMSGHTESWPVKCAINRFFRTRIFSKPARGYRPRNAQGASTQPKPENTHA